MLILCLLVNFKIISQEDTQSKPYVILSEVQAKQVVKDLKSYDGLKKISAFKTKRIENFKKKELVYQNIIVTKDSIITEQRGVIDIKDKIINAKKPLEFHSYVGIETYQIEFINSGAYFRAALESEKFNLGAKLIYRPNELYDMPHLYYNFYIEYKIF